MERIAIHVSWVFSGVSGRIEKRAITGEVRRLVAQRFTEKFPVGEVPEIVVEWGDEDRAIMDIRAGKLVIVLKRGRENRYDNIARALTSAIPDLLAPEMKTICDAELVRCLSAHAARSIAKENQAIVAAINEAITTLTENDAGLRRPVSMLVEIDDQSLFSRTLIPEVAETVRIRYPHRDPSIDREIPEQN